MPNWLTNPLIRADDVDKPSLTRSPARARVQGFLEGALEANTSPLDVLLTTLPYGKLAKAAKGLPAAIRGLRGAIPAVEEAAQVADPLMDAVKATQQGPVGPNLGRRSVDYGLPTSPRGLGLEVERRAIEGQTMPKRKLLPPASLEGLRSGGF